MDVKTLMLQKIRFGYEHLWVPSAAEQGAAEKYSVEVRIPKTDTVQKAALDAIINEIIEDVKKNSKGNKLPKEFKVWLFDGDDTDKTGYEGYWFFSAKSDRPVGVFGTQRDENDKLKAIDKSDFKAGDWGNVSIGVFGFTKGTGGISFFLNGVQKKKDGDAIASGASSADFDDLPEDEENEDDLG